MIPYIEVHTFSIGPILFQAWGAFVAIGFVVAVVIAAKRAEKKGLKAKRIWDMAFWIFIAAMLGSRVFHVIFYEPAFYIANPLEAFNPTRPGFAILGGFIGGALAAFTFVKRNKLDFLAYADALAWGLPWGLGIGRIGCFLIHDHPGVLTTFFMGVKYPGGVRHDLGLYLSILGFLIGISFLLINKYLSKEYIKKGFWPGLFVVVYGVVRFGLDFLRIADTRWWILTPTQWMLIPSVAFGVLILLWINGRVSLTRQK